MTIQAAPLTYGPRCAKWDPSVTQRSESLAKPWIIHSTDVSCSFVKWNLLHIQLLPPEISASQNVVGLFVGEIIALGLCDTMFRMGSEQELSVVAIVMGTPVADVRVECR